MMMALFFIFQMKVQFCLMHTNFVTILPTTYEQRVKFCTDMINREERPFWDRYNEEQIIISQRRLKDQRCSH